MKGVLEDKSVKGGRGGMGSPQLEGSKIWDPARLEIC